MFTKRLNTVRLNLWENNLYHIGEQNPEEKYITWGLIQDPFKGYPEQKIKFKFVHNMDIGTNSDGKTIQVRNQTGDLTVLIGSDPFLPQPESPAVEPEFDIADEDLNTPPLPSPTATPVYETENSAKPLHPYLEAGICLDFESKQILKTPTSPFEKDPPLTELKPVDPETFASPPPRKRGRRSNSSATSTPLENPPQTFCTTDHPPPFQRLFNPHHKGTTLQ